MWPATQSEFKPGSDHNMVLGIEILGDLSLSLWGLTLESQVSVLKS